jgi:hypothetical protein
MSWGAKPCFSALESGFMTPFFIPYLSVRISTYFGVAEYPNGAICSESSADSIGSWKIEPSCRCLEPRGVRFLRSGHFKRFIYSPRWLVCFYIGYRVGNSTPAAVVCRTGTKDKLNFLLKNYISKKIFQHIIGTGRSRGAFCYRSGGARKVPP